MAVYASMVESMDRNIGTCAEWEAFGFDLDPADSGLTSWTSYFVRRGHRSGPPGTIRHSKTTPLSCRSRLPAIDGQPKKPRTLVFEHERNAE